MSNILPMSTSQDISTAVPDQSGAARGVKLAFAALVVAMLPAVLDQTILATALPTVAGDLGRLADVSLLVTAYVVASTAATPLWGKLGDRLGHKPLLLAALLVFVAASCVCGASQTLTQLVGARVVQGVAAGGLMTLAMASVGQLVEPRERGRYQGYIAAAFAGAAALGPLVGGLLVDEVSWRWVFYVNLPLGLIAAAGLAVLLPADRPERKPAPLDAAGAGLLAAATSTLLLACVWGGDRHAWDSPTILGLLGATVLLGVALVARERRAADPVVPFALLTHAGGGGGQRRAVPGHRRAVRDRRVRAAVPADHSRRQPHRGRAAAGAHDRGHHDLDDAGRASDRQDRRVPPLPRRRAWGMMAVALAADGGAGPQPLGGRPRAPPWWCSAWASACVSQVLLIAVQSSVDRRSMGTATAATSFFRALGGALGAAALGAVFAAQADDITAAVQLVFGLGAVIAVAALLVVSRLPEGRLPERAGA